ASVNGRFLERAVLLIPIQFVRLRVVGHEEIQPSVAIDGEEGGPERFRAAIEDAARCGDILERAIAAVSEQPTGVPSIRFRRAVGLLLAVVAAEDVVLDGPPDVIADEEIQQAVAIEIKPQCGRTERCPSAEPALSRDVHECSFTGISKHTILAYRG